MIPEDFVPPDLAWPIVLGLDPGTRTAGYGALVVAPDGPRFLACGTLRAPARLGAPERLGHLLDQLETLLLRLRPAVVAIESAFSARNVRSALRIGEARGMALAAAARRGIRVAEYAPAEAKKTVLGHGSGSKEQVAAMVCVHLGRRELDVPLDATDALALALTHVRREAREGLLQRGR